TSPHPIETTDHRSPSLLPQHFQGPLDERGAGLDRIGGGQLEPLRQLEFLQELGIELAGADIQALAGKQEAAQAELAITLGVDQRSEAAEHRLVDEEDDVGRVALSGRMDVHRAIEPIPGL